MGEGSLIPFRQDIRFARTADELRIAYAVSGQGYPLVRAGTWTSSVDFPAGGFEDMPDAIIVPAENSPILRGSSYSAG